MMPAVLRRPSTRVSAPSLLPHVAACARWVRSYFVRQGQNVAIFDVPPARVAASR